MIKFDGKIVQFGFGAVGKSFFEKVCEEIKFNENAYFIITKNANEFEAFINLGGMAANFIVCEITKNNFRAVLGKYLNSGDLFLDFADIVGTKDICEWCAEKNIMYLNTGDADWPENWLNIFEQNISLNAIKEKYHSACPIVLQHGNNPGLVSHFVKSGIEYIINTQYKKDRQLKNLIMQNKFNEAAHILDIKIIHVNDIDLQKINSSNSYYNNSLINTWCIDSFLYEMITEAAFNAGVHENINYKDECRFIDLTQGFIEFKKISAEKKCRTYYPDGAFDGFLVPHDETVSIAKSLEIRKDGKAIYRPSVMFLYSPCHSAAEYLSKAKVNEYPGPDPAKPPDCENENGQTIIRGYMYPKHAEIVYKEKIISGTEYVGALIMGENFEPVWVGNRVKSTFLYKNKKNSYWQTPTVTPVAMSALAAVCWMLKNKDSGGVYFPDDIPDYKYILKIAEKYISKTIYKTFDKQALKDSLKIDFSNLQAKDFFI